VIFQKPFSTPFLGHNSHPLSYDSNIINPTTQKDMPLPRINQKSSTSYKRQSATWGFCIAAMQLCTTSLRIHRPGAHTTHNLIPSCCSHNIFWLHVKRNSCDRHHAAAQGTWHCSMCYSQAYGLGVALVASLLGQFQAAFSIRIWLCSTSCSMCHSHKHGS
jgi:hypothetical protein